MVTWLRSSYPIPCDVAHNINHWVITGILLCVVLNSNKRDQPFGFLLVKKKSQQDRSISDIFRYFCKTSAVLLTSIFEYGFVCLSLIFIFDVY